MIKFPYANDMDSAAFRALSDEEAFNLCFKGCTEGECNQSVQTQAKFKIERMPYQLEFKNTAGYYKACNICDSSNCKGCTVPYKEDETVQDMLDKFGLDRNNTLFSEKQTKRGKEVVLQVNLHPSIDTRLY